MGHYRGGISWSGMQQFNVHPLCMVIGMVFLYGDAILVHRVFRNETKRATKILHGVMHCMAFIIAIVGLVAVFEFHRKAGITDMYSLHSWCGIVTFGLFFIQWILGFTFFLFPGVTFSLRSYYKPVHTFFGISLFALSIGTCLLGILEKILFSIPLNYARFEPEGVLANVLGLLLVAFGISVGYIVTKEEWRRPPLSEEQALSMDFKTLTEGDSPSD